MRFDVSKTSAEGSNWTPRQTATETETDLPAVVGTGDLFAIANAYTALGLSVIPVKADGSKSPMFYGWREFSDRRPTEEERRKWFFSCRGRGIGVTGGSASGNLAVFDFETWPVFVSWGGGLSVDDRACLARCPVVGTPRGGAHVYIRLVEPMKGCKLARTVTGETLIEVRGAQHCVVAPGSPARCHPTGRRYRLLRPGWLDGGTYQPMPLDVWCHLTLLAAELNEYRKPLAREVVGDRRTYEATGDRPGDHFNARVRWSDILAPHDWKLCQRCGDTVYWTRPGKKLGISASTGFCSGQTSGDLLYCFSTSAAPLEAETAYSRFAVYAILNHGGDFGKATKALANAGYGRTRGEWLQKCAGKGAAR